MTATDSSTAIKEPEVLPPSPQPPFDANKVYWVPIPEIFADDDFNCRGIIDPTTLIELSRSISEKGLEQPIILQPWGKNGKRFRIVAGYRRYKAHQLIKAKAIRALVREDLTDIDARVLNLTENLHRADLNVKQEAWAIKHLKDAGLSQPDTAFRIGKSRGWVQERFYLLELPDDIQDEVVAGFITMKDVRAMQRLHSVDDWYEYVRKVKDAKIKGNKREIDPDKVARTNERRVRGREEIFDLQEIIRNLFGNSMTTRALGWAAGEVSDLEFHKDLRDLALEKGKFYSVPSGLEGTHAKVVA